MGIARPETLKHKHLLGKFTAKDPHWWKHTNIQMYEGYWGGETAAAIYTKETSKQRSNYAMSTLLNLTGQLGNDTVDTLSHVSDVAAHLNIPNIIAGATARDLIRLRARYAAAILLP